MEGNPNFDFLFFTATRRQTPRADNLQNTNSLNASNALLPDIFYDFLTLKKERKRQKKKPKFDFIHTHTKFLLEMRTSSAAVLQVHGNEKRGVYIGAITIQIARVCSYSLKKVTASEVEQTLKRKCLFVWLILEVLSDL